MDKALLMRNQRNLFPRAFIHIMFGLGRVLNYFVLFCFDQEKSLASFAENEDLNSSHSLRALWERYRTASGQAACQSTPGLSGQQT